eukprot:2545144-Pleurochrysis_carterae.AAC.1
MAEGEMKRLEAEAAHAESKARRSVRDELQAEIGEMRALIDFYVTCEDEARCELESEIRRSREMAVQLKMMAAVVAEADDETYTALRSHHARLSESECRRDGEAVAAQEVSVVSEVGDDNSAWFRERDEARFLSQKECLASAAPPMLSKGSKTGAGGLER